MAFKLTVFLVLLGVCAQAFSAHIRSNGYANEENESVNCVNLNDINRYILSLQHAEGERFENLLTTLRDRENGEAGQIETLLSLFYMGTNLDIDEQLRILEPIFNGASVDNFKTRLEHAVTPVQSERIMRLVQKVVVQVNDEDTLRVDEIDFWVHAINAAIGKREDVVTRHSLVQFFGLGDNVEDIQLC